MWIIKTNQELAVESEKQRTRNLFNIFPTLLFSVAITGLGIFLYSCDNDPDEGRYETIRSASDVWENRYWFLLLFGATFVITHIITVLKTVLTPQASAVPDTGFRLCLTCDQFHPKHLDTCPNCNHNLVDPRHYRWVEQEPEDMRDTMDDNGGKSGLNQTDKDLCGLLLLVNHRIRNAGSMLFWVLVVASLFLCVSIHMRWFDSLLGVSVDRLRNFGVYVLIAGIAFVAIILTAHLRESMVYRAKRTEILSRLRKNKLSIEALLAEIANDDNLKQIRNKMMHDKDIQQEAGGYRR